MVRPGNFSEFWDSLQGQLRTITLVSIYIYFVEAVAIFYVTRFWQLAPQVGECIKLWSFSNYQWVSSALDSRGVRERCGPEFVSDFWDPLQSQPGTNHITYVYVFLQAVAILFVTSSGSWQPSSVNT